MFQPLPEKLSFSLIEKEVLAFWQANDIFGKSLDLRKDSPYFNFYEGPPTVNGKPGLHHLMARTLKDLVCRYKSLRGFYVRRQAGWDTHGLPVELAMEKELGFTSKKDIEVYGVAKFNARCKEMVYRNIEMDLGWRTMTTRMGYWVDLDTAYITCTNEYIESLWWALKQFFEKGLIYKGYKVVPQSPTLGTPLSSHELSLGYKEVRDANCYLKVKIAKSKLAEIEDAMVIVWTTTPWTLFANVALAVGERIEYSLVQNTRTTEKDGVSVSIVEKFVLATSRLSILEGEVEVLNTFFGSDLIGTTYEQLFPFVEVDNKNFPNALTILPASFVTTEDGSGIVHQAPAFGADDYEMAKRFNLPVPQPVTPFGRFTEELGEFAGRTIKTFTYPDGSKSEGSDRDIVIALKKANKIYKASFDYVHNYPHCWRTDNPVMYYARESWFIKSPAYREQLIELNKTINWQPPEIGSGRFGNWLDEVKEWSLSRDRYWGTPLPLWLSEDGEILAIGSIAELKQGKVVNDDGTVSDVDELADDFDLHRQYVDRVFFEKNGKRFNRVPEVIDVWFDSGAVPFAQLHYPFENKELFEKTFPADFIAEGIDQTRGWFYTLHNISTALFGKPAFKNIIVNELILDKSGNKMSKSKGNTVDPFEIMEKYGADAVRWYFMVSSPPWRTMKFNESDIANTVLADFFRTLTNTYAFFSLYANIDGFIGDEETVPLNERPEIDRWVISKLNSVLAQYISHMDSYDVFKACRVVQELMIDDVSNWYVRRNRRRFWKGEKDSEKIAAYQTLKEVIVVVLQMMAPASPFLSDDLFRRLRTKGDPESIHLTTLPIPDELKIDTELERRMTKAQIVVFLARSLREKAGIKTRQPLKRIMVPVESPQARRDIQQVESLIKEEINVKTIDFLADESGIVRKSAKGNFKTLGKKYGKNTQAVADAIKLLAHEQIVELERKGSLSFPLDGVTVTIETVDIEISSNDIEGWLVASDRGETVALDIELTEELRSEGLAREFINRVQSIRKKSGFEVTDRISISIKASEDVQIILLKMADMICTETLAEKLDVVEIPMTGEEIVDLDGVALSVSIEKMK